MSRDSRQIGALVDGVLGRHGLGRAHRRMEVTRRAWVRAAGDDLASHTRVRNLRDGVLFVEVDSAPLCHRLAAFERERLLLRLQESPEPWVAELRFRLGAFNE